MSAEKPKFSLFQNMPRAKPRILINVGCLMDIPTASFVVGKKGETFYNGGLGPITGICGTGNNYKSTIMHYMMLSAFDKMKQGGLQPLSLMYDTEDNVHLDRLNKFASKFENINPDPTTTGGEWIVTTKSELHGNTWAAALNNDLEEKAKDKKSEVSFSCFKDPYTGEEYKEHVPTFVEIDSLTEFEAESTSEILTEDLDTKDSKTYAMSQGGFKTKFLSQLPRTSAISNTYFLMSAHSGDKIDMNASMYAPQPTKKLQYLKADQNLKGVGSKFFFLTTQVWFANQASLLKNQTTKLAEYPKDGNDKAPTDLNVVRLTMLRNKNGPSGGTVEIVLSQSEGLLPSLTEFHFIKENERYGLSGNNTHYSLDLYPDVSLSRTTVRSKIDNDPLLRRALNITAELLQLHIYKQELGKDLLCTPKELYEDIKKLGYDWNILLKTRGYWLPNQYTDEVPFLSTIDLLNMRVGKYTPYFLSEKKK